MTHSPLSSPLSRTLSVCLITLMLTSNTGISEPAPQASSQASSQKAQVPFPLTLTRLKEGFKVVGLIISEELASEALPAAREALRVAHSSANDNTHADPFALDEALLTLADALHLEAGRCSGELDRLRRLMAWLDDDND